MPVKNTPTNPKTLAAYKQLSYEYLAAAWLLKGGWEVFKPLIDHGRKTDLLISDGINNYRIQVKSIASNNESIVVNNKWKGAMIDYVFYFSRTGEWGYITPAFFEEQKPLNSLGHIRFHQHPSSFLKAFTKI